MGKNVKLGHGVIIQDNVTIGNDVVIHPYAVIGDNPQHITAEKNPNGKISIGDKTIIREFVTVHSPIEKLTKIGRNCYLMATSHVAHDCILNNNIVLCNSVNLSGHTMIDNNVTMGLNATTHQFTTIGAFSMIGMNTPINNDILPFTVSYGNPSRWHKLNRVGLMRHATKEILNEAERILSWGTQNLNNILPYDGKLSKQDIIGLGLKSKLPEIHKAFLWFCNNKGRGNRKIMRFGGIIKYNFGYEI